MKRSKMAHRQTQSTKRKFAEFAPWAQLNPIKEHLSQYVSCQENIKQSLLDGGPEWNGEFN